MPKTDYNIDEFFGSLDDRVDDNSTSLESVDHSKSLETIKKENEESRKKEKHTLAINTYNKLFWAIVSYVVLIMLILTGNNSYFQLDSSVLIALLTSTTANIIGVFYIASKWVYETK